MKDPLCDVQKHIIEIEFLYLEKIKEWMYIQDIINRNNVSAIQELHKRIKDLEKNNSEY